MIEKQFFNKTKTITYNAEIWLKAEKFFKTIQHLKLNGSSMKFHVCGEMFLVSNTWGEYKKRYTGIHAFNIMGGVKPLSGVNLDDDECERSQNTVLLASTQAVYKAPHSTVQETQCQTQGQIHTPRGQLTSSSGSSRKSQSIRLEHNTVESVAASCTYASVINASKDIQCICFVQT